MVSETVEKERTAFTAVDAEARDEPLTESAANGALGEPVADEVLSDTMGWDFEAPSKKDKKRKKKEYLDNV